HFLLLHHLFLPLLLHPKRAVQSVDGQRFVVNECVEQKKRYHGFDSTDLLLLLLHYVLLHRPTKINKTQLALQPLRVSVYYRLLKPSKKNHKEKSNEKRRFKW